MIGLALVTLVTLLAAGIITTFKSAVDDLWKNADYAVTAQNNFSPIPISVAAEAAKAPGVDAVGSVRAGQAQAFGSVFNATAVNPAAARFSRSTGRTAPTRCSPASATTAPSSTKASRTTTA